MESAKEIVRESLPIKCLEAVVLSLYLTSPLTTLQRFAIGFKSKFGGLHYHHIVLGVYWGSVYGALGMSRRSTLMYKPFSYSVRLLHCTQCNTHSYRHTCRHTHVHTYTYAQCKYANTHYVYMYPYMYVRKLTHMHCAMHLFLVPGRHDC